MRIWLNRAGEVSLREQLVTQVTLGILCHELVPGQRLPSTRELARRYGIHANTASAAYKQLESEGWLEFRHGSGVFVRAKRPTTPLSPELATEFALDQLIGDLMASAHKLGVADSLLRERLRRWLTLAPPSRWLVIEPDAELRRILMHEMRQALKLPVAGCTPEECAQPSRLEGSIPIVAPSKADLVRKLLPVGTNLTVLQVHPVSPELLAHMQRYMPEHAGELVGIASRWKDFQRIAQTMLIAAGLSPESLLVRDAAESGWKRGLDATVGVVCDAVTALELPPGVHPLRFTLLDATTLTALSKQEEPLLESE
ncbi:MAG TPA: GntR family transcriptional regulator [Terracidiphilus sp.]|jgi:GntR family transcriptional regulator